jgi:hypothetical protein
MKLASGRDSIDSNPIDACPSRGLPQLDVSEQLELEVVNGFETQASTRLGV